MADRDVEAGSAPRTSRRSLLLGAGAVGAAGALAGCGSGTAAEPSGNGGAPAPPAKTTPPPIKVADIPVGGGKIYAEVRVVVTQPRAGEFRAFDATCQHAGCLVAEVKDGVIICPCHGSTYNVTDGSVHNGPTTKPLPPKTATVTGDTIAIS